MPEEPPDDGQLDGCALDFDEDPMLDDPALFALFAEALDPNDPKTVEEAETEWRELFSG